MTRPAAAIAIVLASLAPVSLRAQSPTGEIVHQDSLSVEKKSLRNDITSLRDTLDLIASIHARILRAQASGMGAVAISAGRQLSRACHAGAFGADRDGRMVASMHTNSPVGDRALKQYHGGLDTLAINLRVCERDDSALMAGPSPDRQKLAALSAAAVDAIRSYELIRDVLLTTLEITLPVRGKMFRG
jgi:hypothetical protein